MPGARRGADGSTDRRRGRDSPASGLDSRSGDGGDRLRGPRPVASAGLGGPLCSPPWWEPGVSAGTWWRSCAPAAVTRESLDVSACSRSDQFDLDVNVELCPCALGCDRAGGQALGERQTGSVTER
jgi:hypothetical protein